MDGLQKVIIPMTLDLLRRSNQQIAVVNVGEAASRQLEIALTRGRIPFIPGDELSVTVYALKPDGNKVFAPCEISGNIVRMNITTQMTAASGVIKCNLRIGTAGAVLFSSMFYLESYDTVFGDDAIESTDEFSALSQAMRYQHIRYASKMPTSDADIQEDPDNLTAYIGVAVTASPVAPSDHTKYKWCSYRGKPGAIFTPHVSEDGILSWTNDQNLENPTPVNIKGPTGDMGPAGPTGAQGETGPAGIVISETEPTDESHPVWIRPSGEYIVENLGISGATVGQVPAVKAVDENGVPTEWEAADSDGGSKPFVVTVTYGDDDTLTADKTHAEIVEAYAKGAQINAKIVNYPGVMVPSILPLYVNISDEMFMFSGSGVLDGSAMAMTAIDTNGSWRVELAKLATLDDIPTEVFTINLAADSGGNITADKMFAEIKAAHDDGKVVNAKFADAIVPLCSISDSEAFFAQTNANSGGVFTASLFCTSDNVWSMSQNGFDAHTLGISGASVGQIVKIKTVDSSGVPTEWEPADMPSGGGGTDTSLGVTGATVGQTVKIKAVGENGVPTEWEATYMASGEDEWTQLCEVELTEATNAISQTWADTPMRKIKVSLTTLAASANTSYMPARVFTEPGTTVTRYATFYPTALPIKSGKSVEYIAEVYNVSGNVHVRFTEHYGGIYGNKSGSTGGAVRIENVKSAESTGNDPYGNGLYEQIIGFSVQTYGTFEVGTKLKIWGVAL